MKPVVSLMIAGALLSGCATRTPYARPAASLPAEFTHQAAPATAPAHSRDDMWWRSFGDPKLDALVDLAIARNPDLAAAAVRVRRAKLEAGLAGAALAPIPSGSLSTGLSQPMSGAAGRSESASGSLSLTWEADLFGRLDARREAAQTEARATAEDEDGVFLTMVGATASLYWQIAVANERIALGEQSLTYARRAQALVETQYKAGASSALDLREIDQTTGAQEAALTEARQARVRAQEALMVLLDGASAPLDEPQSLGLEPLPAVASGLPADLVGRRPDVRAAELRLRSLLASADATKASFYPALTLTAATGTSSRDLLNFLANPVATLGAGLTLPFLNVNAMRFETQIARTRYDEAVILFRKSLYSALAEVETALSARTELATQGLALRRARDAAADAERLYEVRYRAGAIPLRTWLDAQERRRAAELALSSNQLAQLQNQVTLHQALGGGLGR